MGSLYRFLEPLILYALREEGPAHGYELLSTLQGHALTETPIDGPALYRTLRILEQNGQVVSAWETGRGPARRRYAVTAKGRRHLQEWREVLDHLQVALRRFVAEIGPPASKAGRGWGRPGRPRGRGVSASAG
ncbi:MAG: transcriptional regulator, PadR-like family [Candidatus Ozemobacter sibiricus]|uniref:Transcriptional regulator, PadR-like family n=1 Tax=Candidatus Ozemobacter sibiricus TaxID=2268124 RepID=A0A367ZUR6_9BACT|nr:MAG: transcriptional regulator, PadR-like family [Candidatus Ozemobacter sibiricus]